MTFQPGGILSILYPRQPSLVFPSNSSRHPACFSASVRVLCSCRLSAAGAAASSIEISVIVLTSVGMAVAPLAFQYPSPAERLPPRGADIGQ